MGYNRFLHSSCGDRTVMLLTTSDFCKDVEGNYRLLQKLVGYSIDICLVPNSQKDTYADSSLFKIIGPNFRIGDVFTTQIVFYDEDYRNKQLEVFKHSIKSNHAV